MKTKSALPNTLALAAALVASIAVTACGSRNPADPNVKAPVVKEEKKLGGPESVPAPAPGAPVPADASPAALALGTWILTVDADGMKGESRLTIDAASVTMKNSCSFDGKTVEGEATTKAVIDATTIDLQESLEKPLEIKRADGASVSCDVHLEKSKIAYEVKEGQLHFTVDGQDRIVGARKL